MEKRKSIQVSETVWRVLRQRALDEGMTVGRVVEAMVTPTRWEMGPVTVTMAEPVKVLTYDRDE